MGYQSLWLFLYAQYAHIMFEIVPIALITNIVISIMASLLFVKLSKKGLPRLLLRLSITGIVESHHLFYTSKRGKITLMCPLSNIIPLLL